MALDPLTAGLGAVQGLTGLAQTIIGGSRARKAQKRLENLATPTTTESAEISDYYNRAAASPYDTAFYKMQRQNQGRATAQGLGALRDRRSGIAGISSIIRAQNDASLRAGSQAEQMQRSMLGQAVGMRARDMERVFNINKMMPYQKLSGLYQAQAIGGNQVMNAGLQNLYGGLGTLAMGAEAGAERQNRKDVADRTYRTSISAD